MFTDPWKNVVATLYHQLVEARTNPDVEDAIRDSSDLNADHNLGWVSDSGLEIGDFPLHLDVPLTSVVREVLLANGSGYVPVQLPYSNFVHGPEGPIAQPHHCLHAKVTTTDHPERWLLFGNRDVYVKQIPRVQIVADNALGAAVANNSVVQLHSTLGNGILIRGGYLGHGNAVYSWEAVSRQI